MRLPPVLDRALRLAADELRRLDAAVERARADCAGTLQTIAARAWQPETKPADEKRATDGRDATIAKLDARRSKVLTRIAEITAQTEPSATSIDVREVQRLLRAAADALDALDGNTATDLAQRATAMLVAFNVPTLAR